jgi:hypothetical protein
MMWSALKEQVLLMHDSVKESEQDCSLFMMTMLPLYKYGLIIRSRSSS